MIRLSLIIPAFSFMKSIGLKYYLPTHRFSDCKTNEANALRLLAPWGIYPER